MVPTPWGETDGAKYTKQATLSKIFVYSPTNVRNELNAWL